MNGLALRIALVAAGLICLVLFATYVVGLIREDGSRDTLTTIEKLNTEAGNAGENARLGRRECVARGMRFDFEAGKCLGHP